MRRLKNVLLGLTARSGLFRCGTMCCVLPLPPPPCPPSPSLPTWLCTLCFFLLCWARREIGDHGGNSDNNKKKTMLLIIAISQLAINLDKKKRGWGRVDQKTECDSSEKIDLGKNGGDCHVSDDDDDTAFDDNGRVVATSPSPILIPCWSGSRGAPT